MAVDGTASAEEEDEGGMRYPAETEEEDGVGVVMAAAAGPKDGWNVAYSIYLLLGAGYLVPWNAYITAIDYFELLYPRGQIGRVFSILYMVPAVFSILLITAFGRNIPSHIRVNAGLVLFIAMLLLVPLMNIFFIPDNTGTGATYGVTIFAVVVNGIADALVQGSIVGSTGELPERYMQALMVGTAISGTSKF